MASLAKFVDHIRDTISMMLPLNSDRSDLLGPNHYKEKVICNDLLQFVNEIASEILLQKDCPPTVIKKRSYDGRTFRLGQRYIYCMSGTQLHSHRSIFVASPETVTFSRRDRVLSLASAFPPFLWWSSGGLFCAEKTILQIKGPPK